MVFKFNQMAPIEKYAKSRSQQPEKMVFNIFYGKVCPL